MPFGSFFIGLVQARNANVSLEQSKKLEEQRQQAQLKLAYLNIQTQAVLEERREVFQSNIEQARQRFQERMEYLRFGQQASLEEARQAFQLKLTQLNNQQQTNLQEFIQSVNLAINQKNLDFQKWRFEQEKELQQQLAAFNRQIQFKLAEQQRETAKSAAEAHKLFENWPLTIVPSQILNSFEGQHLVPLRVFISPPVVDFDKFGGLEKQSFLKIEKFLGDVLQQFLQRHYPFNNHLRPLELLDGAWDSKRFRGGSSIRALFSQLKSEPTLILESEIDGDHLSMRVGYWAYAGAQQERYFYQPVIGRLSYRQLLNQSAKTRATKWQETRQKLLKSGVANSLEEIDKLYGQHNPDNWKRLEQEQQLHAAGIEEDEIQIHYEWNSQDVEWLYQIIADCHCLITACFADAHYLIHHNVPPLLPKVLPELLTKESGLPVNDVLQVVINIYQDLFKAISMEQTYWMPDLAVELAQGLFYLPEKRWAILEIIESVRLWLQNYGKQSIEIDSLTTAIEAIQSNMTVLDETFVKNFLDCVAVIGEPQIAAKIDSFRNAFEILQAKQKELDAIQPIARFVY